MAAHRKTYEDLTEKQKNYALNRVRGMSLSQSYLKAGYTQIENKYASIRGAKIEQRPHVKEYIKHLRESEWVQNVLTIAEKRSMLADLARVKPNEVTEESQFASISIDAEGNRSIQGPKISDKLKAIELDAKIAGELRESDDKNQVLIQLIDDRLTIDSPKQNLLEQ